MASAHIVAENVKMKAYITLKKASEYWLKKKISSQAENNVERRNVT